MNPAYLNIIVGIILVVGGLSGKLVFIGTNSGILLVALGAAIGGYGIYQLVKYR